MKGVVRETSLSEAVIRADQRARDAAFLRLEAEKKSPIVRALLLELADEIELGARVAPEGEIPCRA
jgi:hypothetical protein